MNFLKAFFSNKEQAKKELPKFASVLIRGPEYKTVKIGRQIWMAENLKVTQYRNGDAIQEVKEDLEWRNLTTGAYCKYENNTSNSDIYGYLYNWYVINDDRNIAPNGWHIPTKKEWLELISYLGGMGKAGRTMKEANKIHWNKPNFLATNQSGFSALPGGLREHSHGKFDHMGYRAYFWSSTESNDSAMYCALYHDNSETSDFNINKKNGFSIRCVQDK